MAVEDGLHLGRPDLVAGRVDHALEPVDHEEVAVLVDAAEIAGAKEGLAIVLDERGGGCLRIAPITLEHLRAARQYLADFAAGDFARSAGFDYARVGVEDRDAQALLLGPVGGVDMGRRNGFRQTVAFDVVQPGEVLELLRHRLGHRRATATDAGETVEAVVAQGRIGEEVDRHGGDVGPAVHAVMFDQPGGRLAVPALHQDHRRAHVDGAVHAALHAGDVKERQRGQHHGVGNRPEPDRAGHGGEHHRGMGVDATLGQTGGAGGERHHAQVVGRGLRWRRCQAQVKCVLPGDRAGIGARLAWGEAGFGNAERALGSQVVAVGGDDHVRELAGAEQGAQLRIDLLADDGGSGAGIVNVMAQFLGEVHRVHRHHHRIGAQDGVIGDDELRAVLHQQQHAVAAAHAAALPQIAGQSLGLAPCLGIRKRRIVEHRERLVGIAPRRHLEVVVQRCLRYDERVRQFGGPGAVSSRLHSCSPRRRWSSIRDRPAAIIRERARQHNAHLRLPARAVLCQYRPTN